MVISPAGSLYTLHDTALHAKYADLERVAQIQDKFLSVRPGPSSSTAKARLSSRRLVIRVQQ
jgi:hypothetical protein